MARLPTHKSDANRSTLRTTDGHPQSSANLWHGAISCSSVNAHLWKIWSEQVCELLQLFPFCQNKDGKVVHLNPFLSSQGTCFQRATFGILKKIDKLSGTMTRGMNKWSTEGLHETGARCHQNQSRSRFEHAKKCLVMWHRLWTVWSTNQSKGNGFLFIRVHYRCTNSQKVNTLPCSLQLPGPVHLKWCLRGWFSRGPSCSWDVPCDWWRSARNKTMRNVSQHIVLWNFEDAKEIILRKEVRELLGHAICAPVRVWRQLKWMHFLKAIKFEWKRTELWA